VVNGRECVYGIYFILDPQVTGRRDPLVVARGALQGGARVIQLRDKIREKGIQLPLAHTLLELCQEYNALLIINDHADLAVAVGAGGLHVGQRDLPVAEARMVLYPWQLVGRSNNTVEEATLSEAQEADHVAVGPIYPTTTKDTGKPLVRLETLRQVKEKVSVPVVAIGGINESNIGPVVLAGADAVCVASAVGLAVDPLEATRRLVSAMADAGGKV